MQDYNFNTEEYQNHTNIIRNSPQLLMFEDWISFEEMIDHSYRNFSSKLPLKIFFFLKYIFFGV